MAVNLSPVGGVAAQFFDNSGQVLTGGKLYTYLAGTTTPAATYTTNSNLTANSNPIVLNAAGRVADSGEIWLTDGINYKFVLKDSNDVQIAVWDNISGINSNFVNYTLQEQTFTATQGQTVFTLTGGIQYTPATNNLSVFVNGSKQVAGTNYLETSSTVFTFLTGLNVGDVVDAITAIPVATNVISSNNVSYNQGGTGAVTTNVQAKLQQTVNLLDFGANTVPGTTDMTAALNAAIAAVSSGGLGGTINLPPQKILITSVITLSNAISSGITFQGAGRFATVFIQGYNGDIFDISCVVTFKDFSVSAPTLLAYPTGTGIKLMSGGWAYCNFINIHVYGFSDYGFYLTDANSATLIDCTAGGNKLGGFFIGGGGNTLIGCTAEDNIGYGFLLGSNSTAIEPYSQNNGTWQILMTGNSSTIINPSLAALIGNTSSQVFISGSFNTFQNPTVINTGGATYIVDVTATGTYNTFLGLSTYPTRFQASSTGNISFAANAVTDAGILNQYYGVSGNWTPKLAFGGVEISTTSGVYSIQQGSFVRNGNFVTVIGKIAASTLGSGTGAVTITNLPYTANNTAENYGAGGAMPVYSSLATSVTSAPLIQANINTTTAAINLPSTGTISALTASQLLANVTFWFNLTYRVG